MLFIADWEHFSIAENVLVIGVENMENFRRIREQRYLFPKNQPLLFISRYPQSTDLRQWLTRIPNTYLHYGDFDLAGLQIYEHEFYKHLGARASFFIPNDIEERIKLGSFNSAKTAEICSSVNSFKGTSTNIFTESLIPATVLETTSA